MDGASSILARHQMKVNLRKSFIAGILAALTRTACLPTGTLPATSAPVTVAAVASTRSGYRRSSHGVRQRHSGFHRRAGADR